MLERPGVEIVQAPDGNRGLEIARQSSVDIVVTDILMPEKDGLELIQSLRKSSLPTKIIAISGGGRRGRMNYLNEAEEFGADAVLAKPFAANDLRRTVAALLPNTTDNTGLIA